MKGWVLWVDLETWWSLGAQEEGVGVMGGKTMGEGLREKGIFPTVESLQLPPL